MSNIIKLPDAERDMALDILSMTKHIIIIQIIMNIEKIYTITLRTLCCSGRKDKGMKKILDKQVIEVTKTQEQM
jgi:hypothetical protein